MFSAVDIKRVLGKNLLIHPVRVGSIRGASIDLRASKFAWSLRSKESVFDGTDALVFPPRDTVLLMTQESIAVDHNLGGTLHSKVGLSARGLSHISSTLDPHFVGNLLLSIHNYSDDPVRVEVDSEIVTLVLFRLNTPDLKDGGMRGNGHGHAATLGGMQGHEVFDRWRALNAWSGSRVELSREMTNSVAYKELVADAEREARAFGRRLWSRQTRTWLYLIGSFMLAFTLLALLAFVWQWGFISWVAAQAIPILGAAFVAAMTLVAGGAGRRT